MAEMDEMELCCHGDYQHNLEPLETPSEDAIGLLADFYKIFGDKTRIRILYLLKNQDLCVCDLAECLGMTSPAVSHQLRILKTNRLIKSKRQGKSMFYSLDDQHIHGILNDGMTHVDEMSPQKR
ncbi:MAG: metalloregulator ArsR/SmtB family transcription factor [Eubacteriales bacterium]